MLPNLHMFDVANLLPTNQTTSVHYSVTYLLMPSTDSRTRCEIVYAC